jgi:hypothetical protein
VTTDGERLATVEAVLHEVRHDVAEIRQEQERSRDRLHRLEGVSASFLSWQKDAREKEDAQYRRLGNIIGLGGLLMSCGLVALAIITLITHVG